MGEFGARSDYLWGKWTNGEKMIVDTSFVLYYVGAVGLCVEKYALCIGIICDVR